MTSPRAYFDKRAAALDRRHTRPNALQPGPSRGLGAAVDVVRRQRSPSVLDVGCGTGRVGAAVVKAGASEYVAIDVSPRMLRLTAERVPSAELLEGDFLAIELSRTYDVVLALGVFDYVADAAAAAAWLRARCRSTLVASFTRWDWLKGPVRHAHYELVHRMRVFDYTEQGAEALLRDAGFATVDYAFRGRRGFVVTAS